VIARAKIGRDAPLDETSDAKPGRWSPDRYTWFAPVLGLLALLSRMIYRSHPYFVDGPAHERAISSGILFIQPPGYFLYGEISHLLCLALHVSPAVAMAIQNIGFSCSGVIVFAVLATRLYPGLLGSLLAVFYAFSDTDWFVSDIHSTYASMTFFAPALLYSVLISENWLLTGVLWALMTGYRPSDGVFVLPFLLWMLWSQDLRGRAFLRFAAGAIPFFLIWYVPTLLHFHAIAGQSGKQVAPLVNGIFTHATLVRKAANIIHLGCGAFNAWNILTPFVVLGVFQFGRLSRVLLLYLVPGCAFWLCYFYSDQTYFSYLIAPGVLLAALALRNLRRRAAEAVVAAAVLLSVAQMTLLRPLPQTNLFRATVNSYFLDFTGAAIKARSHESVKRYIETQPGGQR
jgi:hypothetical protein